MQLIRLDLGANVDVFVFPGAGAHIVAAASPTWSPEQADATAAAAEQNHHCHCRRGVVQHCGVVVVAAAAAAAAGPPPPGTVGAAEVGTVEGCGEG